MILKLMILKLIRKIKKSVLNKNQCYDKTQTKCNNRRDVLLQSVVERVRPRVHGKRRASRVRSVKYCIK